MTRAIVIERRSERADAATSVEPIAKLLDVDDEFLGAGPVRVAVEFSSVNYKDALAIMGRPGVARTWPLIAGIDLVGTVESSSDERWTPGDRVVLNGAGLGESRHGGLAERAHVDGGSLVAIPGELSSERAAAIGTAGFTAMLSVLALERQGVLPGSGEVLVTGAAGGVGSVAIALLAKLGYTVTASTGRVEQQSGYLLGLGAAHILDRHELSEPGKPLQSQRWAGAIDAVGSHTLANVLAQTNYGGTVTACGLAQGADLPASMAPFILRGVTLAGVNSVEASLELRQRAWSRLADDLDPALLDGMTSVIPLEGVFDRAREVLDGSVRGRTVVSLRA
ncbi:MDR family oxidoreductase [Compostimonas suwonensis]|uniref:Acrylyl-CoA reductase (NADPH) n=1 Tax=Compostimonas suwonensis TaxID=1048394 RepID=A0A2M9C3X2_9MICO|nr:MDR family oxidoreductase [Compostimonas suwonensis]PJJ65225.1 acrylyl-CoA reductase (NADPH) [Compostimonas suwonensis]